MLTGNAAGGNTLDGGAGNDVISDGGVNTHAPITMIGGTGDDTFFVNNANDVIIENPGEGEDTIIVAAGVNFKLAQAPNVEVLIQLGVANGSLTGGPGDDTLTGTNGNNVLDGGAGADTMIGEKGNDTYFVDNVGDVCVENPGEGTDKIFVTPSVGFSAYARETNAANVENLTVLATGVMAIIGNDNNNIITGNNSGDLLDGGRGTDTLIGGTGDDVFVVNNPRDVIIDHGGTDTGPDRHHIYAEIRL